MLFQDLKRQNWAGLRNRLLWGLQIDPGGGIGYRCEFRRSFGANIAIRSLALLFPSVLQLSRHAIMLESRIPKLPRLASRSRYNANDVQT